MCLSVAVAVRGGRGVADRHVPKVGISGVNRLRPRVVSVERVVEPLPALAAIIGARDALAGGFVEPVGRQPVGQQLVCVAVM